jgi:hypothetical protein
MTGRSATLLLVVCLVGGHAVDWAVAKDAKVGTISLTLPPPTDYCELDATQASDARMLKAIEGMLAPTNNRLLVMSADCTQLTDWRAGKRPLLDNMAQYQTLIPWENGPLPKTPEAVIKDACNQMRSQGEQMVTNMTPDVKARAEQVLKTVKINEMKFMGVVGEEPNACYAAMLQKFHTEVGTDKTQVTVFSSTIVKSKLVYFYLFAPYVSGDSVTNLLAQQKATSCGCRVRTRTERLGTALFRRYDDCRAVGEHLGDAGRDLGCVEAHADDCIGAHLLGMLEHDVEGLLARLLAQLREERDVAAEQRLDGRADVAYDRARANNDSSRHPDTPRDAETFELERRRHHRMVDAFACHTRSIRWRAAMVDKGIRPCAELLQAQGHTACAPNHVRPWSRPAA